MTPEQRAARDAWLSEMWQPVRQYHEDRPTPAQSKPARKPRDEPDAPRESCPVCDGVFLSADLLTHILRSHPESVQKPGDEAEKRAS